VVSGLVVSLAAVAVLLAVGRALDEESGAGSVAARAKPPVVVLILDEFPADSLLGPDGRIDAERFPNFAALAATSTWFPNATTVYDSTFKAVPGIMDARLPRRGEAPDLRSHRRTIYDLFGRRGYRIVAVESGTAVCPRRWCPRARTRRPGVVARLKGGGRPPRLERWIDAIRPGRPGLYLQHTLLPHEPWIYLPSGRQTRPSGLDPVPGLNHAGGFHDLALTRHNEQRYLLQVGFVDREIGRLLRRLRRTGLLDQAVVAVTADHGYAFELGVKDRRLVTERNVDEIAPVPLFIKAPGQREGRVDRDFVRSIDILPTIADLLDVPIEWRHDGRSAFGRAAQRRRTVVLPTRSFDRLIRIGAGELERRRVANRLRRARVFGTGAESRLLFGSPWASVYRIGPHRELLGRRVRALGVRPTARVSARLARVGLTGRVSLRSGPHSTNVAGRLAGGSPGELRDLAVAVNGRVAAVATSFRLRGRPPESFSVLVPDTALREGRNEVRLYEVSKGGRLPRLTLLGGG
jgi:Sulfatase